MTKIVEAELLKRKIKDERVSHNSEALLSESHRIRISGNRG